MTHHGTLRRRSQRAVLALFIGLLWSACASGPQTRDTSAVPADLLPIDGNYLWEVTDPKQGGKVVAHVMGSAHLLYEDSTIDGTVLDAFEARSVLAVELNLDAISVAELTKYTVTYGHFKEGESLSSALGQADYDRLLALLDARKITIPGVDRLRPWLANITLGLQAGIMEVESPPEASSGDEPPPRKIQAGHEPYFLAHAGEGTVVSLETMDEQFSALASMDSKAQVESLMDVVSSLEKGESGLRKVLGQYERGELDEVLGELEAEAKGKPDSSRYLERIMAQRNQTMVAAMLRLVASGERPFVVVGGLHTLGEAGLPLLLRQRGYGVRAIAPRGEPHLVKLPADHPSALPSAKISGWGVTWPTPATEKEVDYKGTKLKMEIAQVPGVGVMVFNRAPQPAAGIQKLRWFYERNAIQSAAEIKGEIIATSDTTVTAESLDTPPVVKKLRAARYHLRGPAGDIKAIVVWADGTAYTLMVLVPPQLANPKSLKRAEALSQGLTLILKPPAPE